jgi:hypothetical protein
VKDHKEIKEGLLEKAHKDSLEKLPEFVRGPSAEPSAGGSSSGATPPPPGLEALIERVTGLEKEVRELKGKSSGGGTGR